MSKKKPVSADVSDQELLHSKLFFGSNQPLNPEMLKQHFSRYGTVLEVYLRPETGTSGNVTFYEMAQPAKLLKEHKYMELPDGSSLEIKEWSSRSDLKMKDIAHVKELRSEVNVQHRKPGHEAPSGTQAIEVQELSVPKNVALLSKTRFKLRLKNKSPNGKALQRMQCPKEVSYVSNGSRGLTASAPSTWGGESKRVYGFGSPGLSIRERGHADMEFEFDGSETKERVHRLSFVFEFGGHQSVTHTVTIKASQDSDQPKFDGDAAEGAKRQVVPAFPEGRQSRVRRWNQTFALGNEEKDSAYGLPPDIVKDVEEVGRSKKINPWNLRDNYKSKMHSLLFVEEAEQRKLIREYDMPSVEFQHVDSYFIRDTEYFVDPLEPMLRLRVPGLAEKRPSLLAGDLVYAWVPGTSDVEYEGYIHLIEMDSILVMFALSFHNSIYRPGAKYSVRFTFNRHSWLISHWALKHVDLDVVWPEHAAPAYDRPPVVPVEKLSLYDKTIQENPKQLLALHVALNRHYCKHKLPFLLFGPFGTGKTKTLVELLHQILQHIPDARVLICAPSNSAVDVFAVNLVRAPSPVAGDQALFRLYAPHRSLQMVPQEILQYVCYSHDKKQFEVPPLAKLKSYKIIASTCISASALHVAGIQPGHFTHIVLDEAAQLMEPEALVPLTMANKHTTVVMTGDPKQLGPRFQNRSVKHHELSRSIMERMATLPAYQNCPPDHHLHPSSAKQPFPHERLHTVHLVENYRSHRLILQFPSQQFYGGTLRSAADPSVVDSLLGWRALPNPSFPILFKSVEGEDVRETDSPSFFNHQEVSAVSELVSDLLSSHQDTLDEGDVGVIAPFYKQVQKIRQALRQRGLRRVTVASIEEMQGKEFKAIFISTTRASLKHQDYDFRHGLGFPHEGRSLNTAITRAVALLVVVGDAYILSQDKYWKALIDYCVDNNSYVGEAITPQYCEQRKLKEANKLNEPVVVPEIPKKNPEPKQNNIPEPSFDNPPPSYPPNNLFPPLNSQDYPLYPSSLQYSNNWPPPKPYAPLLPPSPSPSYPDRAPHPSSRNYLSICKYRNSHQFIAVEERFLVPTIAILDNQNSLDIQIGKFCYSCHVTRSGQLIYVDLVKNPGPAIWHSPLTVSETHLLIQVPDDYFGHPIDILESNALLYIKLSKHLTHTVQSIPVNDSLVKSMSIVNQHPTNLEIYPVPDAPPPNVSANYYNPTPPRNNSNGNNKHNNILYLPPSSSWYNPSHKPRPPKQH